MIDKTLAVEQMKRCSRCRGVKPYSEFNRNRSAADGLQHACRVCTRKVGLAHYEQHRERRQAHFREQNKRRHQERLEYDRERGDSPAMVARYKLKYAVKAGRIQKPDACEGCGRQLEARLIHGHHEDYSRPLDVKWLCSRCHGKAHRG